MTKKPSEAQLAARAKFAAAAKARAAAKRVEKMADTSMDEVAPTPAQPDQNDVQALLARIEELEKNRFFQAQPQLQNQAPLVRSVEKFSVKAQDYPDPRARLFAEDRLVLKNFTPAWWALEWRVDRVQYDKDGVHYSEPRFTVELWKVIEDEEGEPSNKKYKVCTGMFFEDPDSYVTVAHDRGIDVPDDIQKDFLNEMRYLAIRDWVVEAFYPPKPQNTGQRTEMVINNRLVEVVEESSADPVSASKLLSKA